MHYIKHYFQSLIIAWWNNLVCLVGHCIVSISLNLSIYYESNARPSVHRLLPP